MTFGQFRHCLGTEMSRTTMIYTHVLNRGPAGVWSPVDTLLSEQGGCAVPDKMSR